MMKKIIFCLILLSVFILTSLYFVRYVSKPQTPDLLGVNTNSLIQKEYWFKLQRATKKEILYRGEPGNIANSQVVKEFKVNTGIAGQKPTPLP